MFKINKIGVQLIFWSCIFGIHYAFAAHIVESPKALLVLANTAFFSLLLFYGNIYFLFPKFNNPINSNRYLTISILLVIALAFLSGYNEFKIFEAFEVNHPRQFKYPIIPSILKSMFWLMLVQMISTIFMLQEGLRAKTEETKVVVEEKLNTELKYLKAQINPHFLFNALNNIYSLSYLKSDKGPDAVLKLSGMLRYVLEDCQADHVRLSSEIEYIENFIDFQQMKSQNPQNIDFNHTSVNEMTLVAPMLFIPFIENSFKYSKIENTEGAFVKMKLQTKKDCICFEIKNSVPEIGKTKAGSGKGIINTKQRLEILYPNKHDLKISEAENEYKVELKIEV